MSRTVTMTRVMFDEGERVRVKNYTDPRAAFPNRWMYRAGTVVRSSDTSESVMVEMDGSAGEWASFFWTELEDY